MLASDHPANLVCEVLALSRSSYYYVASRSEDAHLRTAIAELAADWPTPGSGRLTAQLRREPHHRVVNRKRVQRSMRELNLVGRRERAREATAGRRQSYRRYPDLVAGLEVGEADEVWASDITYVRLRNEFIYLAMIMDVFTRIIRGWRVSRSLAVGLTLAAIRASRIGSSAEDSSLGSGVQYAATEYTERLVRVDVLISLAEVGHAEQNGYCERVIRTIKEEEVYLSEYRDFEEAREQTGRLIDDVYLNKRIHSSLGYLAPAESQQQWRQKQSQSVAASLSEG